MKYCPICDIKFSDEAGRLICCGDCWVSGELDTSDPDMINLVRAMKNIRNHQFNEWQAQFFADSGFGSWVLKQVASDMDLDSLLIMLRKIQRERTE